jgi:hypothetical protein
LAVLSLAVLPALAFVNQRVGKVMGSRALVADSKETWVCSYPSLTLLLGGWRVRGSRLVLGRSDWCAGDAPVIMWQGWETLAKAREPADPQRSTLKRVWAHNCSAIIREPYVAAVKIRSVGPA